MTNVDVQNRRESADIAEVGAEQDRCDAIELFLQLCDLEEDELLDAVERFELDERY